MRSIEFVRQTGRGRRQHVVISLDDGESFHEAVTCLKASREDWTTFVVPEDDRTAREERMAFDAVVRHHLEQEDRRRRQESEELRSYVARMDAIVEFNRENSPKPSRVVPGELPRTFDSTYEADIPHNWVTGVGDCFDHLDMETRHMVFEAMHSECDLVDDECVGLVEPVRVPHYYLCRQKHG